MGLISKEFPNGKDKWQPWTNHCRASYKNEKYSINNHHFNGDNITTIILKYFSKMSNCFKNVSFWKQSLAVLAGNIFWKLAISS